jgi:D-3-phosphoglycerate dehydrogenase
MRPLIRLLEPLAGGDAEIEIAEAAARGVDLEVRFVTTTDDIPEAARGAQGIMVKFIEVNDETIAQLDGVRVIGRAGVGVDNVDVEAAAAHGIAVINVPDYCVEEVATSTAAFILADARRLHEGESAVRSGHWSDAWDDLRPLKPLSEQVLGIVGLGRIGTEVARVLGRLFRETIGFDPVASRPGVTSVTVDELFRRSDVVTLHCPLDAQTRHLVDAKRLASMPAGSTLVNVSRGGLVDQAALIDALASGPLRSASIDVCDPEPPLPDDAILGPRNLRITNHIAWLSEASLARNRQLLTARCADFLTGGDPVSLVSPAVTV